MIENYILLCQVMYGQLVLIEQSVVIVYLFSGNVLTSIGLQPKPGVELIDWDIIDTLSPANSFLGKDVYLIAFNRGLDINSLNFTLKFKVKVLFYFSN